MLPAYDATYDDAAAYYDALMRAIHGLPILSNTARNQIEDVQHFILFPL